MKHSIVKVVLDPVNPEPVEIIAKSIEETGYASTYKTLIKTTYAAIEVDRKQRKR